MANVKDLNSVILVTPYDSIVEVAQRTLPIFPVSLMLRNRFDSLSLAPGINNPMLALIAEKDTVIPKEHTFNLVQQWQGPTATVVIERAGHNDITGSKLYWESIIGFLDFHSK